MSQAKIHVLVALPDYYMELFNYQASEYFFQKETKHNFFFEKMRVI